MKVVLLHSFFLRDTKKISRKVYEAFRERAALFRVDPFNSILENHPLRGKYLSKRSINITGDYRAIFKEEPLEVVTFVRIGRHRDLYE